MENKKRKSKKVTPGLKKLAEKLDIVLDRQDHIQKTLLNLSIDIYNLSVLMDEDTSDTYN